MKSGLLEVLDHARHERPVPLTAEFSDEVMAKIAQVSDERPMPVSGTGIILAAVAAVVVAAGVSIWMTSDNKVGERPSLAVFGSSAGDSLFGKR